jgi:hypothetical protein
MDNTKGARRWNTGIMEGWVKHKNAIFQYSIIP